MCACERLPPHATLRTTAAPGARWFHATLVGITLPSYHPSGARWFHATLVDADVAINAMMWQNAGRSGIDQVSEGVSERVGSSVRE